MKKVKILIEDNGMKQEFDLDVESFSLHTQQEVGWTQETFQNSSSGIRQPRHGTKYTLEFWCPEE